MSEAVRIALHPSERRFKQKLVNAVVKRRQELLEIMGRGVEQYERHVGRVLQIDEILAEIEAIEREEREF